jgi:hypothetical protein
MAGATDLNCYNWDVNVPGYSIRGALVISNLDAAGNLTGTLLGDPIQGFYNNKSDEMMFVRQATGSPSPALTQF